MNYTAESLVNKLREEEGVSISVRTLNYYAYDKKMFPDLGKGKCAFTDKEYEMLKRITYLKDKTSMSLDEIRDCIANDKEYDKQVDNVVTDAVSRSKTYSVSASETYSAATTDAPMTISMRSAKQSKTAFINSVTSKLPENNFDEPRGFNDFMNNCFSQSVSSCSSNVEGNSVAYSDDSCNLSNGQMSVCDGLCASTTAYNGYDDNSCTSVKDVIPQTFVIPTPMVTETAKTYREQETTVRINKDVTITVSSDVSRERLIEIINFINSK